MYNNGEVKIRPVILAGGFGRRLWPVSSDNCPKQFAEIINGVSFFLSTLKRVADPNMYAAPIVLGNVEHTFYILAALNRLNITNATVILEPIGRNTATAAIIAALHETDPDAVHLVMPADHNIRDDEGFHNAVQQSVKAARSGHITLFGIQPEYNATGYGYIVPGKSLDGMALREISIFHEKPNETFAKVLINQGALWNSGIFLYHPDLLCEETRTLAPEYYEKCLAAAKNAKHDRKTILLGMDDYVNIESHSLDILIMENTKRGAVLPCSIEWNDIGSWHSIWKLAEKDENGNAILGSVIAENVSNSYIRSEGISIAAVGMKDCVIVATNNTVLVAPCSHAEEIKNLHSNKELINVQNFGNRPWGTYQNLGRGDNFLVKQITIWPGCSISLQCHSHRAEHWVVTSGKARVECDGMKNIVSPHEPVYIPKGAKHRLSNIGNANLQLIEVQTGDYIGEDDITRYEDLYGRS